MGMIVGLLVCLIIIAVIWWLGNYILDNLPLPPLVAQIGRVVITVVLVLYGLSCVLQAAGGLGGISLPHF